MASGTPRRTLTEVRIRSLPVGDRPARHWDGGGLYLEVRPTGARLWRYRYRLAGRERLLALGAYPEVSLARARELHAEARRHVAEGIDPVRARRVAASAGTTFRAVAAEWLERHAARTLDAGTLATARTRLERYAYPALGDLDVARLRAVDVLTALRPLEDRNVLETAHRVRQRISQVLRYAVATGRAERDVTADLRGALPPVEVEHHATIIDPERIGALLRAIDGYDGGVIVRSALRLAVLTFARPGELRAAEWSEVHGDTWAIPAERMKMGQPHIVPLSSQALAVVEDLRQYTGAGRYLFPSPRTADRPMSDGATNAALRRLGYGSDDITSHGFRAMARTILDETLRFPPHIVEQQLAHAVRDPLGRAYNRTSHLDERRAMMQAWADWLDAQRTSGRARLGAGGDEVGDQGAHLLVGSPGEPGSGDGVELGAGPRGHSWAELHRRR